MNIIDRKVPMLTGDDDGGGSDELGGIPAHHPPRNHTQRDMD